MSRTRARNPKNGSFQMNGDYERMMLAICVRKRACKGQLTKAQAKSELKTRRKTI